MENRDLIKQFTDKIIMQDENGTTDLLKQIIINKSKEMIASLKRDKLFEDVFNGAIKLNGDDVVINGKVVGHLKYDLNDMDGGINFVAESGDSSKEFSTVQDLYQFLLQKFGVKENRMEDLGHTPETPEKIKFDGKSNLEKQPGTEGADPDGKREGDLKSKTKGEFKPEKTSAEGATGKYSKLKGLIADIKAGKRKTSTDATGEDTVAKEEEGKLDRSSGGKSPDSVDVVSGHDASGGKPIFKENKENWKLDNADADGEGKEARLKAGVKAIKKIADKQGEKK